MQDIVFKVCGKCKKNKPATDYSVKKKSKLQPYCKDCNATYGSAWYFSRKESRKKIIAAQKLQRKRRAQEFVLLYLKQHGCVDCPEKDPVVLDFDHLRDKKDNISNMIANGLIIDKIIAEIEKCEIRCANCHRRKTAAVSGWYRIEK